MLFQNHIYAFGSKESGTFKQVYSNQSNGTSFVVPQNVSRITVKSWGAGGGGGRASTALNQAVGGPGGGGGYAQGTITVTPGETLTVYVGGGGIGGTTQSASDSREGGGGGGLTGVFRSTTPLIIAGGGGGGGGIGDVGFEDGGAGGGGGGSTGATGLTAPDGGGVGGGGGTQAAGGAGGTGGTAGGTDGEAGETDGRYNGGDGASVTSGTGGGVAGGDLYGGAAGTVAASGSDSGSGGGGGSGYYGGGGGEAGQNTTAGEGAGGGGGGSNYVSGASTTSTQGGTGDASGTVPGTRAGGTAANNTDPDYVSPAGNGGQGGYFTSGVNGSDGNPGRVVLIYTIGDAVLESVSLAANATTTSSTITIPAAAQAGDLAVLFDQSVQSSTTLPTTVVPTNFTSIVNTSLSGSFATRGIFSYKILVSGDPGTSITGMSGTFAQRKILAIFRPVGKGITSVELSTPQGQATDGNPTAQSILMTQSSPVLIGFIGYGNGSAQIDPRTSTGATFSELSAAISLYMKYVIFNRGDTPTDATADMDDEGFNNLLQSFWMKLS